LEKDPACWETDTAAAAASSTTLFAAAAAEGAEEEARAEAIGASDVAGWWMGSGMRRERRALAAAAAVAPPLHMAAAAAAQAATTMPGCRGEGEIRRESRSLMGELGREARSEWSYEMGRAQLHLTQVGAFFFFIFLKNKNFKNICLF
jgi:hypothetical protein